MTPDPSTYQDEAPIPIMENFTKTPRLLASTEDTYSCTIAESRIRESNLKDGTEELETVAAKIENAEDLEVNYFKSAQW